MTERVEEANTPAKNLAAPVTASSAPREVCPVTERVEEACRALLKVPVVAVTPASELAAPVTWSSAPREVCPVTLNVEEALTPPTAVTVLWKEVEALKVEEAETLSWPRRLVVEATVAVERRLAAPVTASSAPREVCPVTLRVELAFTAPEKVAVVPVRPASRFVAPVT